MSTPPNWGQLFTTISSKKTVVVGDIMLDRFVHGSVNRISPEAPVPVLKWSHENLMPGGAANVARNLARYGVGVTLIGVMGKDLGADQLRDTLAREPNIRLKAFIDPQRQTTVKTRFTSTGQQMLRVDHESPAPLNDKIYKRVLAAVETALKSADALILSDYDKGMIDHSSAKAIITMARKAGVMVIADPKKTDPSVFSGVTVMTPNFNELTQMTSLPLAKQDQIAHAANDVAIQNKIKSLLVTLGADGMMLVQPKKPNHHVSSLAQSVYDVSGAGDTVIATLTAALAAGASPEDATTLANIAAGIVVGKSGTATTLPGEVLAATAPRHQLLEKDAKGMVKIWQDAGLKVGFTNGCFDLLHPGHLWLLEKAAATCDRLVVGLNSDASTRKLKGDGRPHQIEERRAAVLSSLPMVDAVVIFDAPTPARLIKSLSPDVLIKGGDYKAEEVVGRQTVIANGGKVVIVPTKPGFSTTRLGSS
ncbi:MAG: bifunctional heptose 7-phosphate kinase/heptose 1-phosphate adenyltransferase [Alphaproteobacteria bacterium]|nr:bifunctional heptose 7-phosphate kinase/heptose 1-phosphate adenyltransferase [Alphaproteobacteria bacterium]